MTHRFHPLFGRELEFVKRRRNYGDDLVYVYGVDAIVADPRIDHDTAAPETPARNPATSPHQPVDLARTTRTR